MENTILQVEIPAALIDRVYAALGVSNKADAVAWIKGRLRDQVIDAEVSAAEYAARQQLQMQNQSIEDAKQDARALAEAEVVL